MTSRPRLRAWAAYCSQVLVEAFVLLAVVEQVAVVLLGVEEDADAPFAGDLGGQAGVVDHRGVVVEPVQVAGRDVEPQEVVPEALERRRLQVVDRVLDLLDRERLLAPAGPDEVGVLAVGLQVSEVVHASVERRRVHLGGVLAHERRVGLVPAELDQLLVTLDAFGQEGGSAAVATVRATAQIARRLSV